MKITWASNAPWAPTGYGTQTAQVLRRLKAAGHHVAVANNYGLEATATTWEGVPILPKGIDAYGNDVLLGHHEAWGGDWLISLYDVWVFRPHEAYASARIASWTPVDHYPVPPEVAAWCKQHLTLAMSKFGQSALKDVGINARYVPHALEKHWQPTPSTFRSEVGIPDDAFLVTINAANKGVPPRKAWPEMLSAFAIFAKSHPDAWLYLHTDLIGVGGIDLSYLMSALDISPDRVRIAPQYPYRTSAIPDSRLAQIYTASDVLLATSMGEGFGLTVLEAQACGLPVIVTDFTAQPELVGAGWTVGYQPYWDWTQGAWWATPNIKHIVERLEESYAARGDKDLSAKAVAFAAQYAADLVFEAHWKPVLAEMEAALKPVVKRQQRRAAERKQRKRAA